MKTKKLLLTAILFFNSALLTFNSYAQTPNQPGAGNCLSFNGTSNYIVLSSTTANFGTGNFSVEFWYNSAVIPPANTQAIIGNRNDGCNNGLFWDIYTNGTDV